MGGFGFEALVILILIFANGVFALAEIALISARKHRLQQRADEGSHNAKVALELANAPNELLSTVQVGITLIGTLSGAFGGAMVAEKLAEKLNAIPPIAPHGQSAAIIIVVLVITIATIILGELVPKRLALINPEMYASAMAPLMKMVSKLVSPAVRFLGWSTDQMLKLLPKPRSEGKEVVEEDIKVLIEQGTETGAFEETEQEMVEGVFELGNRRVVDLMRPRKKIVWIDIHGDREAVQNTILSHSHSRFLVADGNPDHILGYIHVKDLLGLYMKGQPIDLRSSIRKLPAVPEMMTALKALEAFKQSGTHIAVVVNEYGVTEGLITLNDIVEAIVGDLPKVGEKPEPWARRREDGSWLIDGSAPIFELKDLIGINELSGEDEYSYATLGGFVLLQLGRIPSPADHFESDGWRYEVVDMDGNRIDKVLVSKLPDPIEPTEN
jgi:putative hemolysin